MGRYSKKARKFASKGTRFQAPTFHPCLWWSTQRQNMDRFQNLRGTRRPRRQPRWWSLPPRIQVLFCFCSFVQVFPVLSLAKNNGLFLEFEGFLFCGSVLFLPKVVGDGWILNLFVDFLVGFFVFFCREQLSKTCIWLFIIYVVEYNLVDNCCVFEVL